MSTRFSLGKGWTIGGSGLRWGRSIPGVPRGWISTGASGTLVTGWGVRHWHPRRKAVLRSGAASGGAATSHTARALILLVLAGAVAVVIWAFAVQGATHSADRTAGLAAARAAGAPGICLADDQDDRDHLAWTLAPVGRVAGTECALPGQVGTHFVAVAP